MCEKSPNNRWYPSPSEPFLLMSEKKLILVSLLYQACLSCGPLHVASCRQLSLAHKLTMQQPPSLCQHGSVPSLQNGLSCHQAHTHCSAITNYQCAMNAASVETRAKGGCSAVIGQVTENSCMHFHTVAKHSPVNSDK